MYLHHLQKTSSIKNMPNMEVKGTKLTGLEESGENGIVCI